MDGSLNSPRRGRRKFPVQESDTVEFKEAWTDRALKDLAAFANTRGGSVYVGVRDDGTAVGIAATDRLQLLIANQLDSKLRLSVDISVVVRGRAQIIVVSVKPARRLVRLDGRYYRRVGTASIEMSEDEFGTRLREQDGKTWDSWPAEVTVDRDISVQKVRAFVHSAKSRVPCRLPAGISIDDPVKTILRNLDLLIGDRPTNAALLLFGSNPQRVFRSASIRAGYFRNNDDFDLFPECPGTLFEQLEPALRQIQEAYPVRVTFPSGGDVLRRAETPAFPSGALREAVVNALIHRDYTCFGSEIEVKMFADSVWIANPGGLMPHVTLEELSIKPHTSERRNPLLAKICYMDHLVEQYGTGTTRIFDECRRGGFPPPEFVNTGSGFRVTLRRQVATQVDLPPEKLHARQQLAMRHVAVNGSITPAEYQRLTGVSDRTTSRELSQLVKGGLLERKGKRHDLRYSRPARVSDIP